jgi:hypothetical protein
MRSLLLVEIILATVVLAGDRPAVSPALAASPPSIQQIYIGADPTVIPANTQRALDRLKRAAPYPWAGRSWSTWRQSGFTLTTRSKAIHTR